MKILRTLLVPCLFTPLALLAETKSTTLILTLENGQTVTVSEGPGEARSIGSYAVRRYAAADEGDKTTFFLDGQVQARDGYVEGAKLADLNGDGRSELIVIVRSAGSGAYLSAQAFNVEPRLSAAGSVEGLPADADPVDLLSQAPVSTAEPEMIESESLDSTVSESAPSADDSSEVKKGYSETGRKRGCPPGKRC